MNTDLSSFAARLRDSIAAGFQDEGFGALALELFSLQFKSNAAYHKICDARKLTPHTVTHWNQIPAVPTALFKELELTSLAPDERSAVFHSSGTTEQKPSRHFHCALSLVVYQASLWSWFERNVTEARGFGREALGLVVLTPPPECVPHSSLVHMFESVRQKFGAAESVFVGQSDPDGGWTLDFDAALAALSPRAPSLSPQSLLLLGTAFSFVHLLDHLAEKNLRLVLSAGSRVMETGGYKNRSRTMPKAELHALITDRLGVPPENIICEYGMSELSSQAYDGEARGGGRGALGGVAQRPMPTASRPFHFPPWARAQIISPETGREVAEGETGLIRILDLANVFSVAAIQTEDLGVRRGDGFELLGRAQQAESRGCSLMSA